MTIFIHPTAKVDDTAKIGEGTKIWDYARVRNAVIGENCIIGKNVYIDEGVVIGNNCKIQNNVSVYHGVTVEEGVFLGPSVITTNDKNPRAINPDGTQKSATDWEITKTLIKSGASIGAGSVIVCGVILGKWCLVGSGSCVTKDIPDYGLAYGNPAKVHGKVDESGNIVERY